MKISIALLFLFLFNIASGQIVKSIDNLEPTEVFENIMCKK